MRDARSFEGVQKAYIATALLSLMVAASWMMLRPFLFLQFFYFSELFALTHLVTLGFITSLMMGVLLRLSPMAIGVSPRSLAWAWVQYALFFIGASGMVFHFAAAFEGGWAGMAWATLVVWLAAALQIWNFRGLFTKSMLSRPLSAHVASGLVFLFLAASMGALLGFHKLGVSFAFRELTTLERLSVHIHLALVGWVANLIIGFQLKLLPSTKSISLTAQWVRFAFLQLGLATLVAGLVFATELVPFGVMMLALAMFWQLWGPLALCLTGRFREWELGPLLLAAIAAFAGLALVFEWPGSLEQTDELRARVQFAYVYLAIMGYIVGTILVTAFKLIPMWIWKKRFATEFGKRPVPGMKDLQSQSLTRLTNLLLPLAVFLMGIGIVRGHESLIFWSLTLQSFAIASFVVNLARVVRWEVFGSLEYRPSDEDWKRYGEMFPNSSAEHP